MPNNSKLDRRGFIHGVGAAAGLVATASVTAGVTRAKAQQDRAEVAALSGHLEALFGPLAHGGALETWHVVSVEGLRFGTIAVVMRAADGTHFQVDVLRRDDTGIAALAATDELELFLANRGDGSSETHEDHGLGLMALGRFLGTRGAHASVPGLLSHGERAALHPMGNYSVA